MTHPAPPAPPRPDAQDWIARYADAWEFSFDRLDALLAEEQQQQKIAVKRAGTRRRKGAGK